MSNRDPFIEQEAEYVGPKTTTAEGNDSLFDGAYDLDDDSSEFEFDSDQPADWEPPVTPNPTNQRTFAGHRDAPQAPKRAAKRNEATTTVSVSSTALSGTSVPIVQAEHTPNTTSTPEPRHTAPARRKSPETSELETAPKKGVRGFLRSLFGGKEDINDQELRAIQRSLSGTVNVAVINRKGGVGKTLTTALTGMTLATHRGDRVIAVDASPEGGELCDRVEREQAGSVRSLLSQIDAVSRYSHVRTHTSQDVSGLEILGSDPEAVGEPPLTGDEYRRLMKTLRSYYSLIVTDCAQGLTNPIMEAVLDEADVLMLVSEGADGMRSATWVASQLADEDGQFGGRYAHLVDDMIVVITQRSPKTNVDVGKVEDFFNTFARKVVRLPYDQALEGGRAFTLDEVSPQTREAGMSIAAGIARSIGFQEGGR